MMGTRVFLLRSRASTNNPLRYYIHRPRMYLSFLFLLSFPFVNTFWRNGEKEIGRLHYGDRIVGRGQDSGIPAKATALP